MSGIPVPDRPMLEVRNLNVAFGTPRGPVEAVRGVSFSLGAEKLGIVGESGSGKSMTGRSIMRLVPPGAKLHADTLRFREFDLIRATERKMREIRGARISMIMQDPKYSLHPLFTVGEQIAEAFRAHHKASRREARDRAMDMLRAVQISDCVRVYNSYPHEVSGGMGQRVMIAMMLPGPDILIADEPTSALDVTIRIEVLRILDELVESRGLSLIFISHDLNLVATFCDRVLVMYSGRIVETVDASRLQEASHPYTQGLLKSLPRMDRRRKRLPVLSRDPDWMNQ
jgi:peptide/nickel transport system ATP-binding protein